MAATAVLFTAQDKTATVNAFTTTTVTPNTGGLQVILTSAIGSVNSEAQPAITIASGLTGQGTITAIPSAGVGGAATTTGCWAFFVTSNPGTVVPGTYTVTFAGGSLPTAFSVTIVEYQAGDWDPTLGTPIINGCASTVVTTSPTATFGLAPATSSRCGAFLSSRNKTASALGVGTSPWTILPGTDEHQTATPSASSILQERTGTASTLVDGSSWGATGNAIIGWEVPAAAPATPPALPANPGQTWRRRFQRRQAPWVSPAPSSVAVPLTETGTVTDALSLTATAPLTETGTGADALSATATVPLTDSAAGVDALSANATVALTESSTGTDAIAVTATISLTETGTAADAISVGIPQVLPGETGTGVDAISISTTVPLADARPAATDALTLTATVPLSDPRPVTDALSLTATVPLTETSTGTDAIAVARSLFLTDTGTGVDALVANATVSLTEVSSGADAISVDTGSTPVALTEDVGSVESIAVLVTRDFYQFVSPLFTNDRAGSDRFWGQLTVTHSKSILKFGASYVPIQGPTNEQIVAADITYLGGHVYTVTAAEAAALTAAGYGAGLS